MKIDMNLSLKTAAKIALTSAVAIAVMFAPSCSQPPERAHIDMPDTGARDTAQQDDAKRSGSDANRIASDTAGEPTDTFAPPIKAPDPAETRINLRWIPSYPGDSQARVRTGLLWALSLLGAQIPKASTAPIVTWLSPTLLRLDLGAAGFTPAALVTLAKLCAILRSSEAYAVHGGVDAGRFVTLTVATSAHYYRITHPPNTLAAFKALHPVVGHEVHVAKSLVALGQRRLLGSPAQQGKDIAWISEEGPGSLSAGTFAIAEYEVFDVMPNGQLRFAIYGLDGKLRRWADPKHSEAGKPARCMFCHESGVEPMWLDDAAGPGGLSQQKFNALRDQQQLLLQKMRAKAPAKINYDIKDEHSQMELLYVAFMEPTAQRLATEWGLTEAAVEKLLVGRETHKETVYHAWKAHSYHRRDVEALGPVQVIKAPGRALLDSNYEPDLLVD